MNLPSAAEWLESIVAMTPRQTLGLKRSISAERRKRLVLMNGFLRRGAFHWPDGADR